MTDEEKARLTVLIPKVKAAVDAKTKAETFATEYAKISASGTKAQIQALANTLVTGIKPEKAK